MEISNKPRKEIFHITGMSLRSVLRWVKKFNEPRDLDIGPGETPREGQKKKKTPRLLSDVSARTVQRRLHENLKYRPEAPNKYK